MPTKGPTLYNTKKTTIWFAVSSFILFIGLMAMIFEDSHREWKDWQKKFMAYTRTQAEGELAAAQKEVDQKQLVALQTSLSEAHANTQAHQDKIKAIEKELGPIDLEITKRNARYQELKQFYDSEKYYLEEYEHTGNETMAVKYRAKLKARGEELSSAKKDLEAAEADRDSRQSQIDAISGQEKRLKKDIEQLYSEVTRFEKKIEKNKPSMVKDILNAPMLDFIQPSLQIQQIVVENIHDDYYFVQVDKVDRCVTCHLGIDRAGYADAPAPFKAHPRLDLFVASNSPHPMETFGCTSCHGGGGHSVSFTTAAHTPQNEEQAKEWKKKYHWKEMKHWADKMLPANFSEASCVKCHTGEVNIKGAPKLNQGRSLAKTYGCTGCHKVVGMKQTWEVGPDLRNVQSKLEHDWIVRWLHNPKEFRESTKMPKFFHLDNTSDEESVAKSNVTIAGIAAYLSQNSNTIELKEVPKKAGNAEVGGKLIEDLGCLGCHTVGENKANNYGPELTGLGSKVKPEWLFTWLKDPKHYMPETRMPNLRLSDEEAADITAYLLQDKNEKFESIRTPHIDQAQVDEMALHFKTGKMRYTDAKAEIAKMSAEEKLAFVGQKSIAYFGCTGCHSIKGFEDAAKIGTELSKHGSKDVHRLDFGFVPLHHTRQDWFTQKLKNPRIFDEGKVKPYHDKLKMPDFEFSDEQVEALVTFLLSQQDVKLPMEAKRQLDTREQEIEVGRGLVEKFNCQGCHTVDGVEGRVRALFEDVGNAPPIITGTGAKVQSNWLYHFLENPTTIRPWLKYRMPTFGFTDAELTALVQYFNHLDNVPVSFTVDETPPTDAETLKIGARLFKDFQCINCHKSNPPKGLTASFLAPDLLMAKERLRPEWAVDWLADPQALMEGTMMPGYFPDGQSPLPDVLDGDAHAQMVAIRDYLWQFTAAQAASLAKPAPPAPAAPKAPAAPVTT